MRKVKLRSMRPLGLLGRLIPMRPSGLIGPIFFLASCAQPTPEELAGLAAQGYYRHLVAGEYEQFLEGRVGADSLPDDYREQLLAGYRQFMAQQQRDHQGIRDVHVTSATTDTVAGHTNVMLVLSFGDSIDEEIVVPMVERNGSWRMK
jgi:hypothetical protein